MKSLTQSIGLVFSTITSLVFIVPVYLILSTLLAQGMLYLNRLSLTKSSFIYRYLGDISWAIPFNNPNEFRLTQVLLVAITLALLSILILGFMIFSTYGEEKYQLTKAKLIEEIKKEQEKIRQEEEYANEENKENNKAYQESKAREEQKKRAEKEKQKQTSDTISAEMKRRKRDQELEDMRKRQEEMYEEDKKIKEEKKKNNIVNEDDD